MFYKKIYDGEKIWIEFMSMGKAATYQKIRGFCSRNGMVNPMTGRVSQMGPVYAMWRYAFKNPETSYEYYRKWKMEFGEYPTFQDFCIELWDHARSECREVTSEKYKKIFKEKYLRHIQ